MWTISTENGPRSSVSPRLDLLQRRLLELVLVELGAGHGHRQRAAVDRRDVLLAQLAQDPRQRAEVVLVAVGDDDALDVAARARAGRRSRAARGRCPSCRPSGSAGRRRRPRSRPSYSTTVMFLPISPSPPSGRTRSLPLLTWRRPRAARGARAWRGPRPPPPRTASTSGSRRPAHADAHHVQRGLRADRVGGDEQRLVDVLQRGVDLRPVVGLVDHAAHLVAHDVAGHEDAARLPHVERAGQRAVVAGVDVEAVDRPRARRRWPA